MTMNREIKFRGKNIETGEWVYGSLVQIDYHDSIDYVERTCIVLENGHEFDVDPKTVGQYTGLDDRHDDEIYTDDIFRFDDDNSPLYICKYDEVMTAYRFYNLSDKSYSLAIHLQIPHGKIIGDIHDNPELLEGGEK